MKKSELRQIIKEEIQRLNEMDMKPLPFNAKEKELFKKIVKKYNTFHPNQLRLKVMANKALANAIKRNNLTDKQVLDFVEREKTFNTYSIYNGGEG